MNNNFESFDEVIRTYLDQKEATKSEGRDNDWWYASELGMCLRKAFMRRLGLSNTEEKEYRIKNVAEDGNAGHRWRQEAAQTMGLVIKSEGPLQNEKLRYKGRFDIVVQLSGEPVMVDIKTQRPEAFFRRAKKPVGERVEEFQKKQLGSYVYFFNQDPKCLELLVQHGFPHGTKIKQARIYYVDRGGGVREEFVFYFKQDMFDKIIGELQFLNTFWEKKQFPPKDDRKWMCRYCPYKTICTKVEKEKLTVNQIKNSYGSKANENSNEGGQERPRDTGSSERRDSTDSSSKETSRGASDCRRCKS